MPAKATGRSGSTLPPGLDLPIVITDAGTGAFPIDSDAFLASPGRKKIVQRAAADESSRQAQAYTAAVPGMKEKTWASAEQGSRCG